MDLIFSLFFGIFHGVLDDVEIAAFMFTAPRLAFFRNFFVLIFQTTLLALV